MTVEELAEAFYWHSVIRFFPKGTPWSHVMHPARQKYLTSAQDYLDKQNAR